MCTHIWGTAGDDGAVARLSLLRKALVLTTARTLQSDRLRTGQSARGTSLRPDSARSLPQREAWWGGLRWGGNFAAARDAPPPIAGALRQSGTGLLAVATLLTALSDELQAGILDHVCRKPSTFADSDSLRFPHRPRQCKAPR